MHRVSSGSSVELRGAAHKKPRSGRAQEQGEGGGEGEFEAARQGGSQDGGQPPRPGAAPDQPPAKVHPLELPAGAAVGSGQAGAFSLLEQPPAAVKREPLHAAGGRAPGGQALQLTVPTLTGCLVAHQPHTPPPAGAGNSTPGCAAAGAAPPPGQQPAVPPVQQPAPPVQQQQQQLSPFAIAAFPVAAAEGDSPPPAAAAADAAVPAPAHQGEAAARSGSGQLPAGLHHLTRHWLPEDLRGEAVLRQLGAADLKAADHMIKNMGQRELRLAFQKVYQCQTQSYNNNWLRRKLMEAVGLKATPSPRHARGGAAAAAAAAAKPRHHARPPPRRPPALAAILDTAAAPAASSPPPAPGDVNKKVTRKVAAAAAEADAIAALQTMLAGRADGGAGWGPEASGGEGGWGGEDSDGPEQEQAGEQEEEEQQPEQEGCVQRRQQQQQPPPQQPPSPTAHWRAPGPAAQEGAADGNSSRPERQGSLPRAASLPHSGSLPRAASLSRAGSHPLAEGAAKLSWQEQDVRAVLLATAGRQPLSCQAAARQQVWSNGDGLAAGSSAGAWEEQARDTATQGENAHAEHAQRQQHQQQQPQV